MTEKRKRARFPGLNSTRWIRFIEKAPEKGEQESDEAFRRRQEFADALSEAELEVKMLDRATVLEFENRLQAIAAKEDARRVKEPDGPILSTVFLDETRKLHREIIKAYVSGVRGIEVGDVDLETIKDPDLIATLLDTASLLSDASMIARRAQSPTPQQLER